MNEDIFKNILKRSKNSHRLLLIDEKFTYKNFFDETQLFLNFFKRNLKRNNIICICSHYSSSFISLIFASYIYKIKFTLINPNGSEAEKEHVINNSKSNGVFFEKNFLNLKKKKKIQNLNFVKLKAKKNKKIKENDICIIYTSGTSSKPKGVVLTINSLSSNIKAISKNIGIKKKDIGIIFSPPAYAMAISQILTFMYKDASFCFHRTGLKFPAELAEKIIRNKVSLLNISVSAFKVLKESIKSSFKFKSVKLVMSGGMPLTNDIVKLYKKFFSNAKIINFYGCTENSPRISHYKVKKIIKNDNAYYYPVGKSLNGVKIKIKKKYKKDKLGIIYISGKSLMRCYLNNKKEITNSWHKTGDLGYLDKNKDLILTGREDNTFRVGHEKLVPEELESIIKKKFNFEEIIISKVKDKILGWKPVAVIIKKKNKEKINLKYFVNKLQNNFSNYKIPKKIIFLKNFPKTQYGKLDRKKIEKKVNKINER